MEQKKKETNAQLKRRIENAIVFVPKVKQTSTIYFSDKGLRLTVTDTEDYSGYAIIETNHHRHVFDELNLNQFQSSGGDMPFSRPWIFTKRFIEIALENDCIVEDEKGNKSYSYAKLMQVLKAKDDQSQYNIAWYYNLFLYNIFAPLYSIGESEVESFLVYESYMHNIARNSFLLDEHKEDVTNKQFVDKVLEIEKSFMEGMEESVILKALTDEERMQQEMQAVAEQESEQAMEQGMTQTEESNDGQ